MNRILPWKILPGGGMVDIAADEDNAGGGIVNIATDQEAPAAGIVNIADEKEVQNEGLDFDMGVCRRGIGLADSG